MREHDNPFAFTARHPGELFRRSRYANRRQNQPKRERHAGRQTRRCRAIGFSIWERRGGNGRNVTFPARQYAVNGERRSFALLRPIANTAAQNRVRDLVLDAFGEHEERAAVASNG
jgi:hypothetical protein